MAAPATDFHDTLLLVVDAQPALLGVIDPRGELAAACGFAAAAATGIGLPIAFTEQVPQKLGPTAPAVLAAAPRARVWAKESFSALADPAIRAALFAEPPVRHLLLAGLETTVCVYQTAVDALAEGLQVTVLSDCVGARRPGDARACLDALTRLGAHVLPAETVLYALLRDVRHPFFRGLTALVKARPVPHAALPPSA